MSSSAPKRAFVLAVLDGNTLIVKYIGDQRNNIAGLALDYVVAPRVGTFGSKEDEPFGYQAYDFLRKLTVGKRVIVYTHSTKTDIKRMHPNFGTLTVDIGRAELFDNDNMDVGMAVVEAGWGRVRSEKQLDDYGQNLNSLQDDAKRDKKGIWSDKPGLVRKLYRSEQVDKKEFLQKKEFDAIVDIITNGSTYQLVVNTSDVDFYQISVNLAGVKCRSAFHSSPEPFGLEAKQFVESRILQRGVHVTLVGESDRGFVGIVKHPHGGDIGALLLKEGLAEIFNPTISLVPNAEEYRKFELEAKKAKKNMWVKFDLSSLRTGRVDGKVVDIKGSSALEIETETGAIERVYLANVRLPSFSTQGVSDPLGFEARELVRKLTIGQNVTATIDYSQQSNNDPKQRLNMATVYIGNKCLNEIVCQEGLGRVFTPKNQKPSDSIDKMTEFAKDAEAKKIGIFQTKLPPPSQYNDLSNKPTKAKSLQYLHFLQNKKQKGVIEYFSSSSRAVILIPEQNCIIRMNLLGIIGTDPQERLGDQALQYVRHKFLLRDCEVLVTDCDKFGCFIGTLTAKDDNKHNTSVELELVRKGFADLHSSSYKHPLREQLNDALNSAKDAKIGLWADETKIPSNLAPNKVYEVNVKDVWDPVTLVIQIQSEELERINKGLTTARTPVKKVMKGDLVVAIWERKLYRARVLEIIDQTSVQVEFIELLINDKVNISDLRVLPEELTKIPPQCMSIRLGGCRQFKLDDDFAKEGVDYVWSLVEDQLLYAYLMYDDPNAYDPDVLLVDRPDINGGSVNQMVLSKGYARYNLINAPDKFADVIQKLDDIEQAARERRVGGWKYGNVGDDDDEYDE